MFDTSYVTKSVINAYNPDGVPPLLSKGLPHSEAIARLNAKGTQFDPDVVQASSPSRSRKPQMYLPQPRQRVSNLVAMQI